MDTSKFDNEERLGGTSSIQTATTIKMGLILEWSTQEYGDFQFKGVCYEATSHTLIVKRSLTELGAVATGCT